MNLCFICYVLFFPLVNSINNIVTNLNRDHNETLATHDVIKESINKKTTVMISEAGSQLADSKSIALPKENSIIDLKSVNEELGTVKQKSIQARKGAGNPSEESIVPHNVTIITSGITKNKSLFKNTTKESNASDKNVGFTQTATSGTLNYTQTKVVSEHVDKVFKKKPVLSYDALANRDININNKGTISLIKSSINTSVNDQIPPPDRDVKSYKMATKHPGMVTPVVITILVVPVFALLGYMAFTRGREAWKNRHYKRMDFLLDGMYNE